MPGGHEVWQRPISGAEVRRRIDCIHRRYHATLSGLMRAAREAHGHALLIDLHSMPPLSSSSAGQKAPQIVLGDRFGRSCSMRLMTLVADVLVGHGFDTAQNHPYAGDHMVERHGRPSDDLYAMQIEVDRSLYLDAALDLPGPGLADHHLHTRTGPGEPADHRRLLIADRGPGCQRFLDVRDGGAGDAGVEAEKRTL
jgi:N-formylglutamate amidohydrolase